MESMRNLKNIIRIKMVLKSGRVAKMLTTGFMFLSLLTSVATAVPVGEIVIENCGKGPLDEDSVLVCVSATVGSEFSQSVVNRDIKALQKTGRYSVVDVNVGSSAGAVVLTYRVGSKPILHRIVISGADYMGNKKVRKLLELEIGDPVDDAVLGAKIYAVMAKYRKAYFMEPKIEWRIDEDEPKGVADVTMTVKEGPRAKIHDIIFDGNHAFKDKDLRDVMKLNRFRWFNPWHWVSGVGRLERDTLAGDMIAVRDFYRASGFLDVKIGTPEINLDVDGHLLLKVKVEEGVCYKIGTVSLSGVSLFPEEDVREAIFLQPDATASQADINTITRRVREYFGSRGYIDTVVTPLIVPKKGGVVDIEFAVKEGSLAKVRDIRIEGNRITKDKVIRRELIIYPGDVYNETKVRVSESRLRNLGYFDRVITHNERTSTSGLYDLVYEVKEHQMGRMSVGAGFSTIDKVSGFFEISHGNFDLGSWPPIGAGQKLNFRTTIGTERRDFSLSFVEPWFLNRKLSLGVNLFSHERRFLSDDYDQKNDGASLSLTRPFGRFKRLGLTYAIEKYNIYNLSDDASDRIRQEEGKRTKSSLTLALTRDTRDNYLIATHGNRTRVSVMGAGGILQGETDIYSVQLRTSQYWTPWLDHVFSLRGQAGVVDYYGDSDHVPIFDRFFLGGPFTMRGFDYRDVGPVDDDAEPVGGNSRLFGSAEYTIPVVEGVRFAGFYDIGMVWEDAWDFDSSLNSDIGIGVRFDIPMFPIRFDYAWPLETDEHNDRSSGRFSFAIGTVY